jgi:hypothetical protein
MPPSAATPEEIMYAKAEARRRRRVLIPIVGIGGAAAYLFNSQTIVTLIPVLALLALATLDRIPMETPIVAGQPRKPEPLTGIRRFGMLCWWAGLVVGALLALFILTVAYGDDSYAPPLSSVLLAEPWLSGSQRSSGRALRFLFAGR